MHFVIDVPFTLFVFQVSQGTVESDDFFRSSSQTANDSTVQGSNPFLTSLVEWVLIPDDGCSDCQNGSRLQIIAEWYPFSSCSPDPSCRFLSVSWPKDLSLYLWCVLKISYYLSCFCCSNASWLLANFRDHPWHSEMSSVAPKESTKWFANNLGGVKILLMMSYFRVTSVPLLLLIYVAQVHVPDHSVSHSISSGNSGKAREPPSSGRKFARKSRQEHDLLVDNPVRG